MVRCTLIFDQRAERRCRRRIGDDRVPVIPTDAHLGARNILRLGYAIDGMEHIQTPCGEEQRKRDRKDDQPAPAFEHRLRRLFQHRIGKQEGEQTAADKAEDDPAAARDRLKEQPRINGDDEDHQIFQHAAELGKHNGLLRILHRAAAIDAERTEEQQHNRQHGTYRRNGGKAVVKMCRSIVHRAEPLDKGQLIIIILRKVRRIQSAQHEQPGIERKRIEGNHKAHEHLNHAAAREAARKDGDGIGDEKPKQILCKIEEEGAEHGTRRAFCTEHGKREDEA